MAKIRKEKLSLEKAKELGIENWSPWECEPSTFEWEYEQNETAYVLEGNVRIQSPTEDVEIEGGDLVHFPQGTKCTWTVNRKIRKVFTYK